MEITLSLKQLLDDIYSDSAIAAVFGRRNPDNTVPLLTSDHRHALKRVVIHASAFVATALSGRLTSFTYPKFSEPSNPEPDSDEIVFGFDSETVASPEALKVHFSNAVTFACLKLIAISAGDFRRADAYRDCVSQTAETIKACLDNLPTIPSIRPSYY